MASEILVQTLLQVTKGQTRYISQPNSFFADMAGYRGPTPGSIVAYTTGTDVSLVEPSSLGGLCRIMNLDLVNYVSVGIYDPSAVKFYPMMEILPGESYVFRLSRVLGDEFGGGSGTGTTGQGSTLRIKANTTNCNVLVEAFDK